MFKKYKNRNKHDINIPSAKEIKNSMPEDIYEAHKFCTKHKNELKKDNVCGCFYCLKVFNPLEIKNWLNEGSGTALCPHCGIDSVIGESSGYPITEEFLKQLNKYWFGQN